MLYVYASAAHLYIPQLFIPCLPNIICVTLMFVMYIFDLTSVLLYHYITIFL